MQTKVLGECKASLANSPYWANTPGGSQRLATCKRTSSGSIAIRVARLVATQPIAAGEEILLN